MKMTNVDYVNNPNQRTPFVLVLDASYSMGQASRSGQPPIVALNAGMKELERCLKSDPIALTRVQLAIVCVGGPNNNADILMDWTDCGNFEAFPLSADGTTPLAEGLLCALRLIEDGKSQLRAAGISYTRPWLYVISDGEPTSEDHLWQRAVQECRAAEDQRKIEIFGIAVEGANISKMNQISSRPALPLQGVNFRELFKWITASVTVAAKSRPGENINLPSTDPWRNVGL
jgi:uncharacterized protein YegL